MKTFYVIAACIAAYGCGYDDFGELDPAPAPVVPRNVDLGYVKQLYNLYTGDAAAKVTDDMVIAGYVTANDRSGNFYRSFIIDDGTGAIEVRAGMTDLHNMFPLGRKVAVRARGLTVGSYGGVMQIGLASDGGGRRTDYMGYRAVMDLYVFPQDDVAVRPSLAVGAADLGEALCGRLVTVRGVALHREEGDDPEPCWAWPVDGYASNYYVKFRAADSAALVVVTSMYADFARERVPADTVDVTGIVMQGRTAGEYVLKLRSSGDVGVR